MIEESIFCQACGSEVPIDSDVCLKCGNSMNTEFRRTENALVIDETSVAKNNKKKRIQIIISVFALVVALASIAVKIFIVDRVTPEEKAVEEFVQCVTSYKPGVYKNNSYISESFGFRIDFDDNWEVTVKGFEALNNKLLESIKISQVGEMQREGFDEKLINEVVDNSYAKVELKATTLNYGGVEIRVNSNFGINERNMGEVMSKTRSSLIQKGISVTTDKTSICGETYYVLRCTIQNGSAAPVINEIFMRAEGDMVITMSCYYQQGYEEIKDNFIKSISKY